MSFTEERVVVEPGRLDVVGILTSPKSAIPGRPRRLVFIAHGLGGHKDYCYQKMLAHKLAEANGLFSFRFDFRGCGDSGDVPDPNGAGRTVLGTDSEDIDAMYEHFIVRQGFELAGFVSHSRGSLSTQLWALKNQDRVFVPALVNCAGRFRSEGLLEYVRKHTPDVEAKGGYWLQAYRHGAYPRLFLPWDELVHCSSLDTSALRNLRRDTAVLSVYGVLDHIVPLEDAGRFANIYDGRHELQLISGADHNYYGGRDKETGKKVNFNPQVAQIVSDWFTADAERARFVKAHGDVGARPRFIAVAGVNNFRDFGGYRADPAISGGAVRVRAGILYRAANLALIEDAGMATLRRLGIKTVFDLRSDPEIRRMGVAVIPGVDVRRNPVFRDIDVSPEALARRHANYHDPLKGFHLAYKEILDKGGDAFRNILLHLRDRPDDGILIHCTAGKDRTGVACMLILLLMGVDADTVARDYELTTVGLRPEIDRILSSMDDAPAADTQAMRNMLSSKYDAMMATIRMLEADYGGVVRYLKDYCRLSDRDIATIRDNLSADGHVRWPSLL